MTSRSEKTLADFTVGQHVRYVPYHAHGDASHADCENGVVSSISEKYVFVRFRGETGQRCNPDQLV
jgi:hypothetical protein